MSKFLTLVIVLIGHSVAFAQEKQILVINESGYYLMITPQNKPPYFEEIDVVIDLLGNGPTPTNPTLPPTNPAPPAPKEDPVIKQAREVAALIGDKREAEIVGAVYRFFAVKLEDGSMDKAGFDAGFKIARRVAAKRLSPDWSDAWEIFDKGMGEADDLSKYLYKVADGLSEYAGYESSAIPTEEREQATGLEILAIIEAVIALLELLGVLK